MDATQSIYDKASGTSTTDTVTEPTDAEAERRSAQSTSGSGLGAAAQHLASVKSGLSDRRTLVVKLVIVTQKEEIVTQATLDTGSEVDVVSPDFAQTAVARRRSLRGPWRLHQGYWGWCCAA